MLGRAAGIATFSAWAQVASAFLVPGTVRIENHPESLSILEATAKHQLVALPCSDCVFSAKQEKSEEISESDEPLFFIQGGANSVAVNFTVSHDGRRLEVNGEPIYPLGLQIEDIFRSPKTYVHQVPSSASVKDIENGEARTTPVEVTGHGVSIVEEVVVSDTGDVLVPIRFSIFELERQPVSLDDVSVQLLKQASGDLSILRVETLARPQPRPEDVFNLPSKDFLDNLGLTPYGEVEDQEVDDLPIPPTPFEGESSALPTHHVGTPGHASHKKCKTLPATICKLKHMLEAKMHGMRKGGCRGRKGGHGRPHKGHVAGHIKPHFLRPGHDGSAHDHHDGHHHGRPHHMRPHSQHHHQHHHHHGHHAHHVMHSFSRGLAAVMIPTMAGVAVGMAVSLMGLLIGRLIGFLWIKFYRGGRRGYASVSLDERSADDVDSEKHLLDQAREEGCDAETETLPVYEEAPAYEEAAKGQQ